MKQIYRETKQINKIKQTVAAFISDTNEERDNNIPALIHVYQWEPYQEEEALIDNWYILKSFVPESTVIRMAITSFDRHEKEINDKIKAELEDEAKQKKD